MINIKQLTVTVGLLICSTSLVCSAPDSEKAVALKKLTFKRMERYHVAMKAAEFERMERYRVAMQDHNAKETRSLLMQFASGVIAVISLDGLVKYGKISKPLSILATLAVPFASALIRRDFNNHGAQAMGYVSSLIVIGRDSIFRVPVPVMPVPPFVPVPFAAPTL